MASRSFLYRRNGIYYFRWPIPLACRQRMPLGSPVELRTSLRTSHPGTARHLAARHWLAALDVAEHILVSHSAIGYNELLDAIRGRVGMSVGNAPTEAAGDVLMSLGEATGTVEVQALKNALAVLERAGATFHVAVSHRSATIWRTAHNEGGVPQLQIIEAIDDFADDLAKLTRPGIRQALAAERNLLSVDEVHSDQPGLRDGRGTHFVIQLGAPLMCNLSELRFKRMYQGQIKAIATLVPTSPPSAVDCDPISLGDAKDIWVKENRADNGGSWKPSTVSSYESAVRQFIALVGDKLTTELQANDFTEYERQMRTLPKDWFAVHVRTKESPAQIALQIIGKPLSVKSLKDKGSALSLFFSYLKQKGFWHGRYGGALFETVKPAKRKKARHSFSDEELNKLFAGPGIDVLKKSKFPLYIWGSLLLLYTGARPGEISQLQRQDVAQDDEGVWYLRLMPDDDDEDEISDEDDARAQKQFKTASSIRSVPLHPQLIQLGFLAFVKSFKDGERLFPEAFRHEQKASREIGDWFNGKLLTGAGLKRDGVVLYSLRHTVINRFKADATVDHYACAYTGHSTAEDNAVSNRVYRNQYGRGFSPSVLAEKLHPLLDFAIDWQAMAELIKKKKWG